MGTKETLFSCLCSVVMWAGWPFRLWNLWRRKTWKLKLLCPGVTACAFRTGLFASLGLLRNYKWCRNYKLLWMCVASWVPGSLATRLKITTSLGTSLLHPESRPRQSQIQLPKATRRANLMYKCFPSLRHSPPPPPPAIPQSLKIRVPRLCSRSWTCLPPFSSPLSVLAFGEFWRIPLLSSNHHHHH